MCVCVSDVVCVRERVCACVCGGCMFEIRRRERNMSLGGL